MPTSSVTESTQAKIERLVKSYEAVFTEEFAAFRKGIRQKIDLRADKYGTTGKGMDFLERAILEYPETLFNLFKNNFELTDWQFLNSKEGARWFARRFPQYKIAEI